MLNITIWSTICIYLISIIFPLDSCTFNISKIYAENEVRYYLYKGIGSLAISHFRAGWNPLLGVVERVSRVTKNMKIICEF